MSIEGRLQISLYPLAGQMNRVCIQSTRPLQAAQVFAGHSPQHVMMQLPLLFSVCGIAQATAAVRAFQQALAVAACAAVDAARSLLIQMETAREHLWRILIDWPQWLDEPVQVHRLVPLQDMLSAYRKALFGDGEAFSLRSEVRVEEAVLHEQADLLENMLDELIFARPPAQWLQISEPQELHQWNDRAETVAARLLRQVTLRDWQDLAATDGELLPVLAVTDLNRHLEAADSDRFIAQPVWQGRTRETTPLSRQYDHELIKSLRQEYGNGLLTRLVARLVELARIPASIRSLFAQLGLDRNTAVDSALPAGIGLAQVEAARGRLVHRVVLDDHRVQRYQILAPTEWNFHPAGVAAEALKRLLNADAAVLRRQADMLINAVDPCVAYELQVC